MLELLTHPACVTFSIFMIVALSLMVLEFVTGGMLDGLIDMGFDFDIDVDTPDIETPDLGLVSHLLGWLGIGRVPMSIFIVSFMLMFGFFGLVIQDVYHDFTGSYMFGWLALIPAFIIGLLATNGFTFLVSFVIPKEHNQAISHDRMIGKVATVYTTVSNDREGLVAFTDVYGMPHRARALSLNDVVFPKDSNVLLTSYDRGTRVFRVSTVPDTLKKENEII